MILQHFWDPSTNTFILVQTCDSVYILYCTICWQSWFCTDYFRVDFTENFSRTFAYAQLTFGQVETEHFLTHLSAPLLNSLKQNFFIYGWILFFLQNHQRQKVVFLFEMFTSTKSDPNIKKPEEIKYRHFEHTNMPQNRH
jgi:hypothetical protein